MLKVTLTKFQLLPLLLIIVGTVFVHGGGLNDGLKIIIVPKITIFPKFEVNSVVKR